MDEIKLLECPFCGGWAELMIGKDEDEDEYYYCECQECFARTDGIFILAAGEEQVKKEAAAFWNRRKQA